MKWLRVERQVWASPLTAGKMYPVVHQENDTKSKVPGTYYIVVDDEGYECWLDAESDSFEVIGGDDEEPVQEN